MEALVHLLNPPPLIATVGVFPADQVPNGSSTLSLARHISLTSILTSLPRDLMDHSELESFSKPPKVQMASSSSLWYDCQVATSVTVRPALRGGCAMRHLAVYCSVTFVLLLASANAATHTVRPDGSGDYPTIQAAIDAAAAGDTISLASGLFSGSGNRDLHSAGNRIVIRSASMDPDSCVIDCEGNVEDRHYGFYFEYAADSGSSIEGVTVQNAFPPGSGDGAGLFSSISEITVRNCSFRNCSADRGGGICLDPAAEHALIENCSFYSNTGAGAALYANGQTSGVVEVIDCYFADGYGSGGAIRVANGNVYLDGCEFYNNDSWSEGGAIYHAEGGDILATNCRFRHNNAVYGGAMYVHLTGGAAGSIQDCIFDWNYALFHGGAMLVGGCGQGLVVSSCTAESNLADLGGGVFLRGEAQAFDLANCIIASSLEGGAFRCEPQASFDISCCDFFDNAGGDWVGPIWDLEGVQGNFSAEPHFCDVENGDFHLWNYSPCNQWSCGLIGAQPVACWDVQGGGPGNAVPSRLSLGVTPNPVFGVTRVTFALPVGSHGAIEIVDAGGRLVDSIPAIGISGAVAWNRSDLSGSPVPAGIYYARLRVGWESVTRTLVVVR